MNKQKFIFIQFQKEGIHKYPDAATNPKLATGEWDDVSFLSYPHRHIFFFKVQIEIFHTDRDLEFIQVKRQCERWLGDNDILNLSNKSCEMMGEELYKLISKKWPERDIIITVSEDNENGCILQYPKC